MASNDPDAGLKPNSSDYPGHPATDPGHGHSSVGILATSGNLPTTTFVSGTGKVVDATSDRTVMQDTTTAGSAVVALSPDGTTYSNAMAVTTRATDCLVIPVPKGWRVKITLTTSTFTADATYY